MQSGFGATSGDYWMGLDRISALTQTGQFMLIVWFNAQSNMAMYNASYTTFTVGSASTGYQLSIGGFSGNFTYDAFQDYNGYKFTAYDLPSGASSGGINCAVQTGGAWWYNSTSCDCGACLTQAGAANFGWNLGFSTTPLASDTMTLVCKPSRALP